VAFVDLLRMTVLLAGGGGTALAAVTVVSANADGDTRTLLVAAVWWTAAVAIGLILGRPRRAAEAMRPPLAAARMSVTLPDANPGRAALGRLWPVAAFIVVAGVAGVFFPGVAAVGTGFAIAVALSLRAWERAVTAIEDRDGVRFHVEPGSPFEPVSLVRTPGLRQGRPPGGHQPPPPEAPA
jgi:hypothetical protein